MAVVMVAAATEAAAAVVMPPGLEAMVQVAPAEMTPATTALAMAPAVVMEAIRLAVLA